MAKLHYFLFLLKLILRGLKSQVLGFTCSPKPVLCCQWRLAFHRSAASAGVRALAAHHQRWTESEDASPAGMGGVGKWVSEEAREVFHSPIAYPIDVQPYRVPAACLSTSLGSAGVVSLRSRIFRKRTSLGWGSVEMLPVEGRSSCFRGFV